MVYESLMKYLSLIFSLPMRPFPKLYICSSIPESSSFLFCTSHYAPSPCEGLLSRQSPLSTAIWGKSTLLGHLILEDFNRILNMLTLSPEWVSVLLRERTLCPDWPSSHWPALPVLTHLRLAHSSLHWAAEICSSFVPLGRSSLLWILSRIKPTHSLDSQCPPEI